MKRRFLDAALTVIRTKGYAATTVDDLCAEAKATKGAFFHYFDSKEALGVAAADYWSSSTSEFFAQAPYRKHADPLDRFFGYVEFRKQILRGGVPEFTCLVGTMVQETFDTHPVIRDACMRSIFAHAADVAKDIEAAKKIHAPDASWTSESLGLHTQAVLQGSFILAKASGSADVAVDSVEHLQRYLGFLFNRPSTPHTGAKHV